MSSQCVSNLLGVSKTIHGTTFSSLSKQPSSRPFLGIWTVGPKNKRINFGVRLQCTTASQRFTEGYTDELQTVLPVIERKEEVVENDIEGEALEVSASKKIKKQVDVIRSMLRSMGDGEVSISAYDTAWVALVEDVDGSSGTPQFPSSLQWIADNQLPDGSWGDSHLFLAHDRIISTLACVIALKSWNIHSDKCEKGLCFIKENICKLEEDSAEHMLIGFEIAFPSLLDVARKLDIEVPDNTPFMNEIYARRDLKLTRIPKDLMYMLPTTLLYSLEGMPDLEWEKLLQLKCPDGSFLFSPSSTAFAVMQTKDENCLRYLNNAVVRFNGGVPGVYPVDLFEHIWAVDRLQRLGISRYFQSEIKECIDYVYRNWDEEGICWARNSRVHDVDDTAMGFRLLRLHGYDVSADVFQHFKKDDEFFCFFGQSTQATTGIFNLYRASQVLFPGEKILQDAKNFSSKFLREKRANSDLLDKWIIIKDLPGEVEYALDVPWYASLPRLETRFYIEQYGGEDDVWIGKTLYRMPYVSNNIYLDLAKLDYNNCQALHQLEWNIIHKWYVECNLGEYGISEKNVLFAYYLATANIFEPERSKERLAWTKTSTLIESIVSYFETEDQRRVFINQFRNNTSSQDHVLDGRYMTAQRLNEILLKTLNKFSFDTMVGHSRETFHNLHHAWEMWTMRWHEKGDGYQVEAELLVRTLNLCSGRRFSKEFVCHPQYRRLSDITNRVCHKLRQFQHNKVHNTDIYNTNNSGITTVEIEADMQELVQLVLNVSSDDIDHDIKQTFLTVAKSVYYTAYCTPHAIDSHITKVLFERVL